ncbi:MAG TPA: alpha-amylase family glycosyl hydrolase [Actinocrinis sp.]|nr:alpha-amylase family glycosyl hydrolase [Actinocrinis sp.]
MTAPTAPGWLTDAVLYQIYPQSFADSDGDGIGDLPGLAGRLEYLAWLGVDTVWLNPIFASPMRDAGYDIADYLTVDPRYGDNQAMAQLVDQARGLGIRVLLDLVAGHTSNQHPWFTASADDPDDDRYIWAPAGPDGALPPGFVRSPGTREGGYLPNFFDIQPALNFGYARARPDQPWRQAVDAPGPAANRAALREILDHWLRLGISGFRVDMAASLIKDDPGRIETARLWTELRAWLDAAHPDAALLSEWGDPAVSVPAGFHADFFLQFGGPDNGRALRSLWHTRTATLDAAWDDVPCYFDAAATGSFATFRTAYQDASQTIGGPGHIALPTANHDFARLHCAPRTAEQLPAAFAFQLTFPTLPAIYYGDEIGMRYIPDLPDVEGSVLGPTYNRAGSRTPMQWDQGPNAGFSTAPADRLYLPLDPDPDRPTVAAQREDPASLLHLVKELIALRRAHPELGPRGDLLTLHDGYPLVYVRGGRLLVVVNPGGEPAALDHDRALLAGAVAIRETGVRVDGNTITADPFAFGIFTL